MNNRNSSVPIKPSGDLLMYRRLLRYMFPYSWAFVISVLGFLIFSGMQVLLADMLQFLVDTIGESSNLRSGIVSDWVYKLGLMQGNSTEQLRLVIPIATLAIVVTRGIGFFFGNYYMAVVGRHVVHDLRCELFNHNVRLPISYFETGTSAHVVSRITFNVEQVTGAVTNALKIIIREGVYVIFLLAYLLLVNWRLCLVFLAVAPFIAIVVRFASKRFRRISRRIQNSMGDVTHVTSEVVNANREMRIFGGKNTKSNVFMKPVFTIPCKVLKWP